jgi:hypothetical protein
VSGKKRQDERIDSGAPHMDCRGNGPCDAASATRRTAIRSVPMRCIAEGERQAYHLTLKWLREQGAEDPYAVLNTNEFTIEMRSMCPEG